MKPIAYVKKYEMETTIHFNREEFHKDFVKDFETLLDGYKTNGILTYIKFKYATQEMRRKFDQIGAKIGKPLPETIWRYFWAIVVAPMRTELFPKVKKENV